MHSDSRPVTNKNMCFVSYLSVDNFDKYTLYVVRFGEPCRKHHIFFIYSYIFEYLTILKK